MEKLNVILTGATGMVGEGVLLECLNNPAVESVLVIGRRPGGHSHPKLTEIVHADLSDITSIEEQLKGYNACFFCAGVSSVGKKEEEYSKLTYTLTMGFAKTLSQVNPDMSFCYVSGKSTDSTEKGSQMWARVKGKTENDLAKLPFKTVYNFRPGIMKPTDGQRYVLPAYKYVGWLYPLVAALSSNLACTIEVVGKAMINVCGKGYATKTVEVKDIIALAKS
ncbi:MAG: NAD-dependent epimerase/dehydratase family protein [Bacteroidota bacterium]